MIHSPTVALCFSDINQIKHAALFYDIVFPLPIERINNNEKIVSTYKLVLDIQDYLSEDILRNLLGPFYPFFGHITKVVVTQHCGNRLINKSHFDDEEVDSIGRLLSWFNANKMNPIVLMPSDIIKDENAESDDISINFKNISLIDTNKSSWEQIAEIRKDIKSINKIRKLRLFLETNYSGKNKNYIEEDLGKRLNDYDNAVKDHGFSSTYSVLTMILNSKNLLSFGTASFASILWDKALLASAAIGAGVCIELAKITLELTKQRYDLKKLKRDHDLSYLLDIKEKFTN